MLYHMTEAGWPFMQRALELAERGRGYVEPNPLVGAVIVREGQVVGEGWHQRFGAAHAEVNALAESGDSARGGTLYCTLEPCCHHGKTPPCTDAVLRAGFARVVMAMPDPFPQVSGEGLRQLVAGGVAVEVGLGQQQAERLNRPYLKLLHSARPYVHAKWAMTLDGKIATRSGDSRWISGEASRQRVHALRGRMDAIIVGIGTALADDPLLTARPPGPRRATRIVLDSLGRLPVDSQLVRSLVDAPLLVVATRQTPAMEHLAALGCETLILPGENNRIGVTALLDALGQQRMTNVLIEGGAEVLGSFLDAGAIDEAHVFIAPKLAGGAEARSAIAGMGVERIADALTLADWTVEMIDQDVYLHGFV